MPFVPRKRKKRRRGVTESGKRAVGMRVVVGGVARVGGAGVGPSRDRQVVKRMSNNNKE
jgi:hypothetical protein